MNVPGRNEKDLSLFSRAIDDLARGATNAIASSTFTLANGVSRTTVPCENGGSGALPRWVPVTESASKATVWLISADRRSFTVGHNLDSATDRTFRYEMRRA
ncbi:hypothetical protein MRF4_17275 [Methylobacterium radiotolerans]|uniref:hypothetical protein n=1 Tax=Methylobacterium TaxID=407 RepID=UPI002F2DB331